MDQGISIGKLSELTGVAPTTLRAWERRYGLFSPDRSEGGHRLYNLQDVQRVKQLLVQMENGASISEAIRRTSEQNSATSAEIASTTPIWQVWQGKLIVAIEQFDEIAIESVYQHALSLYPFNQVAQQLLLPCLVKLGATWQQQKLGILQEHFFTAWLRNKLGARLHHEAQRRQGRLLIVACLPNEVHELGALFFALDALALGYRVLYLGANTPLTQLSLLANEVAAAALVLSGTVVTPSQLEPDWPSLRNSPIPIFVGGQFASHHTEWLQQQGVYILIGSSEQSVLSLFEQVPPYTRSRP